jgi:hypothetical protein
MHERVKEMIDDLATVATKPELMSMVANLGPEAESYAQQLNGLPEAELRRKSFLEQLGLDQEQFNAKYTELFGEECPVTWRALVTKFNLDSPNLMTYLIKTAEFTEFGRLQKMQYLVLGMSFNKNYRSFRAVENISGRPNHMSVKTSGIKKPSASMDVVTIKDIDFKVQKVARQDAIVAYAPPQQFWSTRKPAEVIMMKLFMLGGGTYEMINGMIDAFQVPKPKEVTEQLRWTLDGDYSKYGWTGKADPETKSIVITPIGWDGENIPEGAQSYKDYKDSQKKKA